MTEKPLNEPPLLYDNKFITTYKEQTEPTLTLIFLLSQLTILIRHFLVLNSVVEILLKDVWSLTLIRLI